MLLDIETLNSLENLRTRGAVQISLLFDGCGNTGVYHKLELFGIDGKHIDNANPHDITIVEQYLHNYLDNCSAVNFNNQGCTGTIEIYLEKSPFQIQLEVAEPEYQPVKTEALILNGLSYLENNQQVIDALLNMAQVGVRSITIYFSGAGDTGCYEAPEVDVDNHNQIQPQHLQTVQDFLSQYLDNDESVNFDDDGCHGFVRLHINNTEPQPQFELELEVNAPEWETSYSIVENLVTA